MAIIAGYAGVGKSWFANHIEGAVDLVSMPYSWILPKKADRMRKELEKEKGLLYHLENPLFPMNYVLEILKMEAVYPYVLIPTIKQVLDELQEKYHRSCLLVYPEMNLKEEYRQRYRYRGNGKSFMDLFVGGWAQRLGVIRESRGMHIPLASGEFLSDAKGRIDILINAKTDELISMEALEKIQAEWIKQNQEWILVLFGEDARYAYQISNIEEEDIRAFLCEVGKLAYERNLLKPILCSNGRIPIKDLVWINSQEKFVAAMYQDGFEVKRIEKE